MKRLIFILLTTLLLAGTCLFTRVEAQDKSKTEQKKTPSTKTISKNQLEEWINQLSEGSFRERRAASNNLFKTGKQALPFLVKGAQRKDAELSTRCFEIILKMYRGKNKIIINGAAKALGDLKRSSNKSVAERAKNIPIDSLKKIGGKVKLGKLGWVEIVDLRGTKVTHADLVHLKGMTNLQKLFLNKTKITDAGLVHLKDLTSLKILLLSDSKITNAGLEHIQGLTNLEELYLGKTIVSDAGLVHLKKMTKLKALYLQFTKITDSGMEHLKGMTKLDTLRIDNSNVTSVGIKNLRATLPEVKIYR